MSSLYARIPERLHEVLKARAVAARRSASAELEVILEEVLGEETDDAAEAA